VQPPNAQHAAKPLSRTAESAAARHAADKAMQRRTQHIRRESRKSAAAAIAALSGQPPRPWTVIGVSNYKFSEKELRWAAATGLPPRPDTFQLRCAESTERWWEHVDRLGGYHDSMVTEFLIRHKVCIKQQAEHAQLGGKKELQLEKAIQQPDAQPAAAALPEQVGTKRSSKTTPRSSGKKKQRFSRTAQAPAAATFAPAAAAAAAVDAAVPSDTEFVAAARVATVAAVDRADVAAAPAEAAAGRARAPRHAAAAPSRGSSAVTERLEAPALRMASDLLSGRSLAAPAAALCRQTSAVLPVRPRIRG